MAKLRMVNHGQHIDIKQYEGHTPGPWKASRNNAYWEVNPANRRDIDPFEVCNVCASAPGDRDGGLQEANARLIAAAPALLAEVKQSRERIAEHEKELARLRQQIKKLKVGLD